MSQKSYKLFQEELYAKNNSLELINLNSNMKEFEKISPNEFIYLISHSSLVCTDSFHCTVFSLIFGKSLCVFDRFDEERVNSRLKTLLETVHKENFWVGNVVNQSILKKNDSEFDYSVEEILNGERERVKRYILENCRN